jgi:hypothetical protein
MSFNIYRYQSLFYDKRVLYMLSFITTAVCNLTECQNLPQIKNQLKLMKNSQN